MKRSNLERYQDSILPKILNGLLFYVVWFVCVANGADGGFLYIPVILATFALHLGLARNKFKEVLFVAWILLVGLVIEASYLLTGVLSYTTENPIVSWMAPPWILSVYLLYATAIDHSLAWLKKVLWATPFLGAISGTLCYGIGAKMGATQFLLPGNGSLYVIGAVWFFLLPFSYFSSAWLDRFLADNAKG